MELNEKSMTKGNFGKTKIVWKLMNTYSNPWFKEEITSEIKTQHMGRLCGSVG